MEKDSNSVRLLEEFFVSRELFSDRLEREKNLVNIATGFVAPSTSIVDQVQIVGEKIVNAMYECDNLKKFSITKKSLAKQIPPPTLTLPSGSEGVSVDNLITDPQVFLQRVQRVISLDKSGNISLDEVLK